MDLSFSRDLQYLSLRTAAAVAHIRIAGNAPDPLDGKAMQRVLDEVAQALAAIAPIHQTDASTGKLSAVDPAALRGGQFRRGAGVLVALDGTEYRGLRMQRRDLEAAIAILVLDGRRF